jgi:hypothetical protein
MLRGEKMQKWRDEWKKFIQANRIKWMLNYTKNTYELFENSELITGKSWIEKRKIKLNINEADIEIKYYEILIKNKDKQYYFYKSDLLHIKNQTLWKSKELKELNYSEVLYINEILNQFPFEKMIFEINKGKQ